MLTRLIYCSKVRPGVTQLDVKHILAKSQANNARDGISGALVFTGGAFFQCLEGDRDAVNETYHRIVGDARHAQPILLSVEEIGVREFGAWSMGYLGYTAANTGLFFKYSAGKAFDPAMLSASVSLAMLKELVAQSQLLSNVPA
jgi:Sensors of blue-light using FAD